MTQMKYKTTAYTIKMPSSGPGGPGFTLCSLQVMVDSGCLTYLVELTDGLEVQLSHVELNFSVVESFEVAVTLTVDESLAVEVSVPDVEAAVPDAEVFVAGAEVFVAGAEVFVAGAEVFVAGAEVFVADAEVFVADVEVVFLPDAEVSVADVEEVSLPDVELSVPDAEVSAAFILKAANSTSPVV
jgi:hypothetical protein